MQTSRTGWDGRFTEGEVLQVFQALQPNKQGLLTRSALATAMDKLGLDSNDMRLQSMLEYAAEVVGLGGKVETLAGDKPCIDRLSCELIVKATASVRNAHFSSAIMVLRECFCCCCVDKPERRVRSKLVDWRQHPYLAAYELQHVIGEGGFSEVWLALHKLTKQKVVIKAVYLSKPGLRPEQAVILEAEAKFLRLLDHPHIVRCHSVLESKYDLVSLESIPLCATTQLTPRCLPADPVYSHVGCAESATGRTGCPVPITSAGQWVECT
ncbi:protein kinase domain-containing protein, partial [Haematococcus lacustris]